MARNLAWGFTNINQPFTGNLRVSTNLLTDLTASDTITVTRLILHFQVTPELGSFLIGTQRIALGIGVASVEAFGVGGSLGLPDPSQSAEIPPRGWLWSDVLDLYMDEGTTDAQFRYFFPEVRADIRAMRKVDRGVCYIGMRSINLNGAAQTVNLTGRVGALCMT